MADQQSVYAADLQLDAMIPTNGYVTLHSARNPTAANEISGNGYARQTIAEAGWTKETVNGVRRVKNTAAITFPTPDPGAWDLDSGCLALWDGVPGSLTHWLFYVDLSEDVAAGAMVSVAAGAFGYGLDLEE